MADILDHRHTPWGALASGSDGDDQHIRSGQGRFKNKDITLVKNILSKKKSGV